MSKIKVLSIAVIVLILLNIGLITIFVFNKPPHPRHLEGNKGPKMIIIERLHFNKKQITVYEDLIKEHRKKIVNKESEINSIKEELYALLATDNQTESTILIAKINAIEKEIEEIHFAHFLDIKKICNAEQLKDYIKLTNELAIIFTTHKKPTRR